MRPWRLTPVIDSRRLRRRGNVLLHVQPHPTNTDPLLSSVSTIAATNAPANTPTPSAQGGPSPPAVCPDTRFDPGGHRPAVAEGERLGRVERSKCDLHLLGASVAARELVAESAQRSLQRAGSRSQERHGSVDRYRIPIPVGLSFCRRYCGRHHRADPCAPGSYPHSVREALLL